MYRALTPSMSVLYCSPLYYAANTRLVTIRLSRHEVVHCNRLVQIYSRDRLFFRHDPPAQTEEFVGAQHCELRYHSEPWTDALIKELSAFQGRPAEAA